MSVQVNSKSELVSNFPTLPEIRHEEYYTEIFEAATSQYTKCFDQYAKKCSDLDNLIIMWENETNCLKSGNASAEQVDSFVNIKINEYINFRKIRNELLVMRNKFDDAITKFKPPELDPATLIILQKLDLNTKEFQEKYDEVFTKKRNDLIELRAKVSKLYESIVPKLQSLKQPLENIKYTSDQYGLLTWGFSIFSNGISQTPLVNKLVIDKEKQLAQFENAVRENDEKESLSDTKKKEKTAAKTYHKNSNEKEAPIKAAGTDTSKKT
jgi:hypothetical protein